MYKLTTAITDNFQYISIENLNVKGMMANHKLEYKSKLKGNILLVIDRWVPSSDLTLKERIYKCEECGIELDRDFNAGINIHNQLPFKLCFWLKVVGIWFDYHYWQYNNDKESNFNNNC